MDAIMYRRTGLLALLALLGLTLGSARVAGQETSPDPYEPPAANQPEYFNGAVGLYTVQMFADRTQVTVGQPIRLLIRITGHAPSADHLPERPNLRRLPKFEPRAGLFQIEYLKEQDRKPLLPGARAVAILGAAPGGPLPVLVAVADRPTWEFAYRLRPLKTYVKEIPSWPFIFYRPPVHGRGMGSYQTVYVPRITLEVTPQARVTAREVQGGTADRRPEQLYQIVEGSAVLRRDDLLEWPEPGALAAILAVCLLIPPILAVIAYRVWRAWNPDAARLARLRRSRAAERALKALRQPPAEEPARHATGIVAAYLRERLDLPPADPTPAEVAAHLEHTRISPELVRRIVGFFETCEKACYAPIGPPGSRSDGWEPSEAARDLILALEAELWLSSAS